jgi:hypothetical protein
MATAMAMTMTGINTTVMAMITTTATAMMATTGMGMMVATTAATTVIDAAVGDAGGLKQLAGPHRQARHGFFDVGAAVERADAEVAFPRRAESAAGCPDHVRAV